MSWLFPLRLLIGLTVVGGCVLGSVPDAHAVAKAAPTVAVMPFRDLTGAGRYVGEAIRETVTADLRVISALRVVERSSLDKILAEQHLQVQQELDPATAAKIGKLLGASLIVLGAYQKLTPQVRLTARFVKVETSEVVGAAKVDGSVHEFLRLQDRVTSALLKSAGFTVHAKQVLERADKRPDLQSLKTLELYGQAVSASNDGEKQAYLQLAVSEDKNFSYAVHDLAELETRMRKYQVQQDALVLREVQVLREKLATTTDRAQISALTMDLLPRLMRLRRYYTLVKEARAFLDGLPAGSPITPTVEMAATMLIGAELILRDYDGVLRDGERFLQRAPGTEAFERVKQNMQAAIAVKRQMDDARAALPKDLGSLSPDARWDLCLVGQIYWRHMMYAEARRLATACLRVSPESRAKALSLLFESDRDAGKFKAARQDLEELEKADAAAAMRSRDLWVRNFPADEETP